MRATVVGGGLAGCAAALELLDADHDVTLLEARPTLGGAVQTLPERDGDPAPPPDNGQHIALGCFTEYLAFSHRIGEVGSVRRMRLSLPVVDEQRRWAQISPASILLARYGHLPLRRPPSRLAAALAPLRRPAMRMTTRRSRLSCSARVSHQRRSSGSGTCSSARRSIFRVPRRARHGDLHRADGAPFRLAGRRARPAADETARLDARRCGAADARAARRDRRDRRARRRPRRRRRRCDRGRDASAESARLLGEAEPGSTPRRSSASISSSTARFCARRWPRCSARMRTGSSTAGRSPGIRPMQGQYLTVVSSGVPELMEVRGRELVDHIAAQLTDRLGHAELAVVARQPRAAGDRCAATRNRVAPPGATTSRPNVTRAGAWTATGWPATMESAVRSGRAAARVLADVTTEVRSVTVMQELTRSTPPSSAAPSACSRFSIPTAGGRASWSRTRR